MSSSRPVKRRKTFPPTTAHQGSSDMGESDDSSSLASSPESSLDEGSYSIDEFGASATGVPLPAGNEFGGDFFSPTLPRNGAVDGLNGGENSDLMDPKYKYESLPNGRIRILVLHPAAEKISQLDCSLENRMADPKEGHEKYEALSYVWGTESPSCAVRIRRSDGGFSRLMITPNLAAALRQLRHKSNPKRFWIDAICINQRDNDEKNRQVPMMYQIYSQASNVCVWLGEADENGPRALALMKKIRFLKNYDRVVETETRCKDWDALTKLMGQTWFSRRWVVQEIALAKSATLYCGEYTIPWVHFAEAVTLFEEMEQRVRRKFRQSKHYNQHPDYFGQVAAFSASKLVRVTNELIRKSEDGRILVKQMSLESLISRLTSFEATRAHDVIYAVLCLAKDIPGSEPVIDTFRPVTGITNPEMSFPQDLGEANLPEKTRRLAMKYTDMMRVHKYPVNYRKSFFEICKDFLQFSMRKESPSLDILCRPWAPIDQNEELPSWIRTLRHAPYGRRPDGYWTRKNADTLVCEPGKSSYSASGKYPCKKKFGDDRDSRSLFVSGFVLDEVSQTEDTARSGVIPATWPKFCGWHDTTKEPPDHFWRTMIGDRDFYGNKARQLYRRSFAEAFSERVEDGDVDTKQIRDQVNNTHLKNFAERLAAVVWNRRLTMTKEHGFFGLTPEDTRPGDLVCILPGCSVPVVLHPTDRAPTSVNRAATIAPAVGRTKKRKFNHVTEGPEDGGDEPLNGSEHVDDEVLQKEVIESTSSTVYTFVGECFIYGMMDGEAFGIRNREDREYEWFEIQ